MPILCGIYQILALSAEYRLYFVLQTGILNFCRKVQTGILKSIIFFQNKAFIKFLVQNYEEFRKYQPIIFKLSDIIWRNG